MNKSELTKQGISRARSKGIIWGSYGLVLAEHNKRCAQEFAEGMRELIVYLMTEKYCKGPRSLARMLNDLEVPTVHAKKWHPATVSKLLKRLQPELDEEIQAIRVKQSSAFHKEIQQAPHSVSKHFKLDIHND